jgi:hypothetical protein
VRPGNKNRFGFLHDQILAQKEDVTEADREGFRRYFPDHPSLIVPVGVDVGAGGAAPVTPPVEPVRLLFVGSLGVRMNWDALHHFSERYFPALKERFGAGLAVRVVGRTKYSSCLAVKLPVWKCRL